METKQLIKLMKKTKKKEELINSLQKAIIFEKENMDAELILNYLFEDEEKIDTYTAQIIALYCIYFAHFIKEEEYEILCLLKELFNLEIYRLITHYKNTSNYDLKRILLVTAIIYNQNENGLTINLIENLTNIEQNIQKNGK